MWPFRRSQIVDAETAAWHVENFGWLARQFGGAEPCPLALPDRSFFQAQGETGHALALAVFERVKRHCAMERWPVTLVVDDNPLAAPRDFGVLGAERSRHALGTFSIEDTGVEITYVPALVSRPQNLVATFAHELSHYLLLGATEPPVCEPDEMEFLTDLTAVFLGFGVFLANARFDFVGATHGWSSQRSGYLPEADLIFALALFIRATEAKMEPAEAALKPHLAGELRRALSALPPDHADVAAIRRATTLA